MPFSAGARLGPYEVVAPLGAGGMGEVYRARDSRLHRDVAVKVLPEDVARDRVRLARFAQEARAAAALNHPNVLSVFDVAIDGPTPYLVSELLEGATLGDRLRSSAGRLSTSRALDYATQMARGLAAAHGLGIVHRDLKPDNVFVTTDGRVKLLDFGLAKLSPLDAALGSTGTGLDVRTDHGQVLGTLGYMAPEQLRGKQVDARADLFSFGAVLYEMLSGRRAFQTESSADTINAILAKDPPDLASSLEYPIAPALIRIVTRCLEKDPAARFQSASDLAFALDAVGGSTSGVSADLAVTTTPKVRRRWSTAVTIGATALATTVLLLSVDAVRRARPDDNAAATVLRFALPPPDGTVFSPGVSRRFSLSPDGRMIAYIAETNGGPDLWVQPFESLTARRLPATQGVSGTPIWSPDGRTLVFYSDGKLKRIDVASGVMSVLCEAPARLQLAASAGGAWSHAGVIVFASQLGQPLYQVPANGGEATPLTEIQGGESHSQPSFFPDGRHLMFVISGSVERSGVWLTSLDRTTPVKLVSGAFVQSTYVAERLVFIRDGVLMMSTFDSSSLRVEGEPRVLAEPAEFGARAMLSAAPSTLVYSVGVPTERQLVWVDRSGRDLSTVGDAGRWGNFDLSPDGTRVVVDKGSNIWVLDLTREVFTQLTFGDARDGSPVWSPDGQRVAFTRHVGGERSQAVAIGSAGGPETVLASEDAPSRFILDDWSPDGRFLTFNQDPSLMALPLDGERKPFPFVQTKNANLDESHFSPDSKWIAYNSNESGKWQVYLSPWPTTGDRWQISTDGGAEVRWRQDGRELYYLSLDGYMMAADVTLSARPTLGKPRQLFQTGIVVDPRPDQYAVSADGQRFLLRRQVGAGSNPLTVVVNWMSALRNSMK